MGVVGEALSAAGLKDEKVNFVDGYTPDKCWFRNGYVTSKMIGTFRDHFMGVDELGDEVIAIICDHINYHNEDMPAERVIAKLDMQLETTINMYQNNRGVPMSHDDENFVMYLLGWRDYCLMQGIISEGKNVQLMKKDGSGGRRGYYIAEA